MSKASEWAERYIRLERERKQIDEDLHDMRLVWHGGTKQHQVAIVQVSERGGVALQLQQAHLNESEAKALARWMLDTFRDAAPSNVGRAP